MVQFKSYLVIRLPLIASLGCFVYKVLFELWCQGMTFICLLVILQLGNVWDGMLCKQTKAWGLCNSYKGPHPLKSTCFTPSLPGPAGYSELWMQQGGHSRLGQGRTHCGCSGEASGTFET